VPGRDLRAIVPRDVAENVCAEHKDAIIDTVLRLFFDILACGVIQRDMQPRNVILRPQKHVSQSESGTRFCDMTECPLALEVDCEELHMVMVDFEVLEFQEPKPSFSKRAVQREHIEKEKSSYLEAWLL